MTKDIELKAIDELIYEVEMFEQAGVYPVQDFIDNLKTLAAKVKEETKLEGCVVVPVDQAKDTARLDFLLEKGRIVSEKTNYNDDNIPVGTGLCVCDVYWIDGMDRLTESIHKSDREAIDAAIVEAARGGNE